MGVFFGANKEPGAGFYYIPTRTGLSGAEILAFA